jgi:hypothetical protein
MGRFVTTTDIYGQKKRIDFDVDLEFINEDGIATDIEKEIKELVTPNKRLTSINARFNNYVENDQEVIDYNNSFGAEYNDNPNQVSLDDQFENSPLDTDYLKNTGRIQELEPDLEDIPGGKALEVKKPKKAKSVQSINNYRFKTLEKTGEFTEEDKNKMANQFVNNIEVIIENYELMSIMDDPNSPEYETKKHDMLQDIVENCKGYTELTGESLHTPSTIEDLTCFTDLQLTQGVQFDESTYNEISKHIQS